MAAAASIVNRTSPLTLPAAGMAATFVTLLVGYRLGFGESAKTAVFIASDTYLWIAVIVGIFLLIGDFAFPRKKKLVFGFSVACLLLIATFGWMIGESLMHV